jgi:hypothetical protein
MRLGQEWTSPVVIPPTGGGEKLLRGQREGGVCGGADRPLRLFQKGGGGGGEGGSENQTPIALFSHQVEHLFVEHLFGVSVERVFVVRVFVVRMFGPGRTPVRRTHVRSRANAVTKHCNATL